MDAQLGGAARVLALQAQMIGQIETAQARYQSAFAQWNGASEQIKAATGVDLAGLARKLGGTG